MNILAWRIMSVGKLKKSRIFIQHHHLESSGHHPEKLTRLQISKDKKIPQAKSNLEIKSQSWHIHDAGEKSSEQTATETYTKEKEQVKQSSQLIKWSFMQVKTYEQKLKSANFRLSTPQGSVRLRAPQHISICFLCVPDEGFLAKKLRFLIFIHMF